MRVCWHVLLANNANKIEIFMRFLFCFLDAFGYQRLSNQRVCVAYKNSVLFLLIRWLFTFLLAFRCKMSQVFVHWYINACHSIWSKFVRDFDSFFLWIYLFSLWNLALCIAGQSTLELNVKLLILRLIWHSGLWSPIYWALYALNLFVHSSVSCSIQVFILNIEHS